MCARVCRLCDGTLSVIDYFYEKNSECSTRMKTIIFLWMLQLRLSGCTNVVLQIMSIKSVKNMIY